MTLKNKTDQVVGHLQETKGKLTGDKKSQIKGKTRAFVGKTRDTANKLSQQAQENSNKIATQAKDKANDLNQKIQSNPQEAKTSFHILALLSIVGIFFLVFKLFNDKD